MIEIRDGARGRMFLADASKPQGFEQMVRESEYSMVC